MGGVAAVDAAAGAGDPLQGWLIEEEEEEVVAGEGEAFAYSSGGTPKLA